jgi:hypothetical protein
VKSVSNEFPAKQRRPSEREGGRIGMPLSGGFCSFHADRSETKAKDETHEQ